MPGVNGSGEASANRLQRKLFGGIVSLERYEMTASEGFLSERVAVAAVAAVFRHTAKEAKGTKTIRDDSLLLAGGMDVRIKWGS